MSRTRTLTAAVGAMAATIGMTIGGASMIIYLAALQTVPEELHEAARMEGANPWEKFWNVTWPALRPAWALGESQERVVS